MMSLWKKWILITGLVLNSCWIATAHASTLKLSDYLDQVLKGHSGAQAAMLSWEASSSLLLEAQTAYAATLVAETKFFDDSKQTMNPSFQGTRTIYNGFSLGVTKLTRFGMGLKLAYQTSYTSLMGTSPLFVSDPQFWEARPVLEFSQPLWRNGFGRETEAVLAGAEAQVQVSLHTYAFQKALILAEAEGTYWRLQAARQIVEIQKESLLRSKKIREWNERRANLELADKSDLFQADAGLKFRELELEAAKNELRSAEMSFNSLRGSQEQATIEALDPLDDQAVKALPMPSRKGDRADVLAAREQSKGAVAQAKVGRERNQPSLDLQGSFALNGRNPSAGTALGQSFEKDRPTWAIGLVFKAPLNVGELSDIRESYSKIEKAAELNTQRKVFEQERDWNDLTAKWNEARERLDLAIKLEDTQKTKLDHERERLKKGRSVTYQVLIFEQDYLSAQLMRLRVLQEILMVAAKMKTFSE